MKKRVRAFGWVLVIVGCALWLGHLEELLDFKAGLWMAFVGFIIAASAHATAGGKSGGS